MPNRNTLWATIFVEELARSGLNAVCAAPGSRHTPLMLAFARHPDIAVYSHLDERSAAFFALGLALATDAPVALVCTSGTAGANMLPAVIEAHQSRVSLIVLTADRPPELRHSGANQTIDQIKLFGDFALWFADMALPEAQSPAVAIRNLRTTANRAYATANGSRKGIVHLNFPFRKPLEPTPVDGDAVTLPDDALARDDQPFTRIQQATPVAPRGFNRDLYKLVQAHERGVIICGSLADRGYEFHLGSVAERIGYPLLSESASQLRHYHGAYGAYDFYADLAPQPDVIIRLGDVPISKALNTYITNSGAPHIIHINEDGVWSDDAHLLTQQVQQQLPMFVLSLEGFPERQSAFSQRYAALETAAWDAIEGQLTSGAYFDGAVAYDVLDLIPDGSTLFAGNSSPVRHVDQFGKPQDKQLHVYANRGASGIDGNISTALGAGAGRRDQPLVALLGDITFYHDMNGLLAIQRCGVPVTIVLLNNDGGGIFNRLPIRDHEPEFSDYFITAHGLNFSHAAALYSLDYIRIDGDSADARQQFREMFAERVGSDHSTLIEVRTDNRQDEARRQAFIAAVRQHLKTL